jgi:hypothetical protein
VKESGPLGPRVGRRSGCRVVGGRLWFAERERRERHGEQREEEKSLRWRERRRRDD